MNTRILFIAALALLYFAGRIDAATRTFQTAGN